MKSDHQRQINQGAVPRHLRIAYAIQNVGGIDFGLDVGDTVPVKHTLTGLRQAGHEVTCLKLAGSSVQSIDDITKLQTAQPVPLAWTGNRLFRRLEGGARRLQRTLAMPYFAAFDTLRFYEACRSQLPHYDLCHEHNGLFSLGTALACSHLMIPYILTVSAEPLSELELVGRPLRGLHAKVAAWEAKYTYRAAKKIITVSDPAKQDLVDNWQVDSAKIHVMPNGVDVEEFGIVRDPRLVRAELKVDDTTPIVCFVGWFQPWHGLDFLVDCFGQVLRHVPEAKLLLVGDGNARPAVEQRIQEHGIEHATRITGLVARERVPEFLAAADVAVLPYPKLPREMWFSPLKLYEYMAAGKAIVGSRSGQTAQVIQDGYNGVLVEPGDVACFAQAVVQLLRDPMERQRLGQNARVQAIEQHSWQRYIRRLEDIYYSVL